MFDFHVSDLGTQTIPNSKYYWQNEKTKCCIIVPDDVNSEENKPALVYFVQTAPNVEVICTHIQNPDDALMITTPGVVSIQAKVFERKSGICERPTDCPKILDYVLRLIDTNSWSFPRAEAATPYISEAQAILIESNFKNMVTAPDDGTCVYATISTAGTMLATRMGIESDVIYAVNHYDMSTNTQVDNLVAVAQDRNIDITDKTVIIIDDLISSGRTANAVIERVLEAGAKHIYYFALYRTVSSREVELIDDPRVTIQSCVPLSNAYWTYGRGFDLTEEATRDLPAIYAATKHWDWETADDVAELIKFFNGVEPEKYEETCYTETIE